MTNNSRNNTGSILIRVKDKGFNGLYVKKSTTILAKKYDRIARARMIQDLKDISHNSQEST